MVVKTVSGFIPRALSCHVPLTSQGWDGMEPSLTLSASRFTARKQQSRDLNTQAHETFVSPTTLFLSCISLADFPEAPCQLPSQQLVKTLSLQLKLYLWIFLKSFYIYLVVFNYLDMVCWSPQEKLKALYDSHWATSIFICFPAHKYGSCLPKMMSLQSLYQKQYCSI